MNSNPTEPGDDTVRLLRPPPRVFTKSRGQTVWMGEIKVTELQLESESSECDPYNNVNFMHP